MLELMWRDLNDKTRETKEKRQLKGSSLRPSATNAIWWENPETNEYLKWSKQFYS